jgi:predicted nucleotidyltransferase
MNTGISEKTIGQLRNLLSKNAKITEAILFGSRAKGTHRQGSDIDIALKGKNITLDDVLNLSIAIDELWIPNKFDLVIYDRITEPELKKHIERVGITILKAKNQNKMIDKRSFINSAEVSNFVLWFSTFIDSKNLPFGSKTSNLIEGFKRYDWEKENFSQTYKRFTKYHNELNNSIEKDDLYQLQTTLQEILAWGGVIRGNLKSINKIDKEERLGYFRNVIQMLDDITNFKSCTKKEIEDIKIISTSGFSKIYSAFDMNYIIYDSRVAYAICSFIKEYYKNEKVCDFNLLKLAHGGRSSTKMRNPNEGSNLFPGYTGRYFTHFESMVKTSWILELLAASPKSKIIHLDKNYRLWALQSALFMIGE